MTFFFLQKQWNFFLNYNKIFKYNNNIKLNGMSAHSVSMKIKRLTEQKWAFPVVLHAMTTKRPMLKTRWKIWLHIRDKRTWTDHQLTDWFIKGDTEERFYGCQSRSHSILNWIECRIINGFYRWYYIKWKLNDLTSWLDH